MRAYAKVLSLALGLSGFLTLLGNPASAQQFSADLVLENSVGQPVGAAGRLYAGNGVVRIETPDIRNGRFLVDVKADTAFFVAPAQHVFMDAKQSSRLTQIFVPVDTEHPCRAWQVRAKLAGVADQGGQWRCERLAAEPTDGRATIKYLVTSMRGEKDYAWIDQGLKFPVKFQFADGSGAALSHISQGPQPAPLFAVPADYRKFDPQRLIDQIKQSDVWVDTPK
jgi:hypothetical protein